jgi:phospholipid-binding lipoprotein MlaA
MIPIMRTLLLLGALSLLCTGCAANPRNPDPLEPVNRLFYAFNDGLDKLIVKPVSDVYVAVIPQPVRKGLGNAFDNLSYPNVIVNDFLQGKMDRGFEGIGRFAVNSTVGVAGVFDVAAKWGMEKNSNDFGLTLATYDATPGPYLVLPLYGPSTLRDSTSIPVRIFTNPLHWVEVPNYVTIPLDALNLAEGRRRAATAIDFRDRAALDPYVFVREFYLQVRRDRVEGGRGKPLPPPVPPDFYDEEPAPTTQPATTPTP